MLIRERVTQGMPHIIDVELLYRGVVSKGCYDMANWYGRDGILHTNYNIKQQGENEESRAAVNFGKERKIDR